jgi:hypothetical protein
MPVIKEKAEAMQWLYSSPIENPVFCPVDTQRVPISGFLLLGGTRYNVIATAVPPPAGEARRGQNS